MKTLNKICLIGNVGSDPEFKQLGNEMCMATFSLATTETWKQKDGTIKKDTQWHKLIAWNAMATVVQQYVKKGSLLHVEGKLQYRIYEDKDNKKHSATEIVLNDIILLDKQSKV